MQGCTFATIGLMHQTYACMQMDKSAHVRAKTNILPLAGKTEQVGCAQYVDDTIAQMQVEKAKDFCICMHADLATNKQSALA